MKLTIDMPDYVYSNVMSMVGKGTLYEEAIKNGTPLTEDTDLISRKAVVELIESHKATDESMGIYEDVLSIPTAAPTKKKAKWICKFSKVYPGWKRCSNCNEPWTFNTGCPPYCPSCGAEMESEQDV